MAYGLNMDSHPIFHHSGFKYFVEGEKHVARICSEDVLLIMLDGTLCFNEDHRPVQVTKGNYYIQKQGLFQEGILPSSDAIYYYIHFIGDFNNTPKALPLSGTSNFTEAYHGFTQLDVLQNTNAPQIAKLAEFYRILAKLKAEEGITQNHNTVLKITSLITEDYQKNYTLEELASITGYSKNHLIRIFKSETGQTPFAYITSLRLREAKALLSNSDMPINEISDRCGFGSYINFYKSFIKHSNISPDMWRKKKRGLPS